MTESVVGVWWVENTASPAVLAADVLPGDGFVVQVDSGANLSSRPLVGGTTPDAVVLSMVSGAAGDVLEWLPLPSLSADTAVLVFVPDIPGDAAVRLLQAGVQDVVLHADAATLAQRVQLAVVRKHLEREIRMAHATDLSTGLPNRPQLLEHMSQLLALREREPKPVSVLVFRIDGLAGVASGHGHESANVVRRKVAVRLRAGVRASDVVASLGADVFAVLLPSTESQADAQRVVDKLVRSLRQPFSVAGSDVGVLAHVGVAHFPQDGRQPGDLLRHASAAALAGAYGMQGAAND
ncbi:MAG TPA: GGDEF domain-containing protein [Rhizobacter sp.]|nr:GGDEF domain-containing protein [Rhizobacter sp.]